MKLPKSAFDFKCFLKHMYHMFKTIYLRVFYAGIRLAKKFCIIINKNSHLNREDMLLFHRMGTRIQIRILIFFPNLWLKLFHSSTVI